MGVEFEEVIGELVALNNKHSAPNSEIPLSDKLQLVDLVWKHPICIAGSGFTDLNDKLKLIVHF